MGPDQTLKKWSCEQDFNTSLEVNSQGGTCELQRAAQRALSRSQQRQTGVFGVRVLQTLHQRDGGVLHKLHQQLRRRRRRRIKTICVFRVSARAVRRQEEHQQFKWMNEEVMAETSGLESSSSESMGDCVQHLQARATVSHHRANATLLQMATRWNGRNTHLQVYLLINSKSHWS